MGEQTTIYLFNDQEMYTLMDILVVMQSSNSCCPPCVPSCLHSSLPSYPPPLSLPLALALAPSPCSSSLFYLSLPIPLLLPLKIFQSLPLHLSVHVFFFSFIPSHTLVIPSFLCSSCPLLYSRSFPP